jgi:hypothetical protein
MQHVQSGFGSLVERQVGFCAANIACQYSNALLSYA